MMLEYLRGIQSQQINENIPLIVAGIGGAIAGGARIGTEIGAAMNPAFHKKVSSEELPKRDADKSTWKGNAPGKGPGPIRPNPITGGGRVGAQHADPAEVMQTTGIPSAAEQRRRDFNSTLMDIGNQAQGLPSEQERLDTAEKIRKERGTELPKPTNEAYVNQRKRMIENIIFSLIQEQDFPVRDLDSMKPKPSGVGGNPELDAQRAETKRIQDEQRAAAVSAAQQRGIDKAREKAEAREQQKQDAAARRSADYRYDDVEAVRSRRPAGY